MPKYYCDYCDTYLTHDSPSVRKTHCSGRKHKENVKFYYQKWMEEQAQNLIDATTAAFKAGKIPGAPHGGGTVQYTILIICQTFHKKETTRELLSLWFIHSSYRRL